MGEQLRDFNRIIERKGTQSIKWDAMKPFIGKEDLMPFWVADMDFTSPSAIIDALEKRAKHGVFGYNLDNKEAILAFSKWAKRRHGIEIDPSWVMRSPGVVTAIGLAIQAFTTPEDSIMIMPPVYPQFIEMVEFNHRKLVYAPLVFDSENRPELDFESIEKCMAEEKPKMLIFCSPHNPLGRIWSEAEVLKLSELCKRHEVLFFSDEIHCDLLFPNKTFYSALNDKASGLDHVVVAMAPSKTFNIAGLGYALVIMPNEGHRRAFKGVMDKLHLSVVDCFNEVAAEAAYLHGDEWLNELMAYMSENYARLVEICAEQMPEVKVTPMEATYLAWLDFRSYFKDPEALKNFMLDEAGLAVNDGRAFGPGGEGFIRFNFGCPREVMEKGLYTLAEALKKHQF